MPQQNKTKFIPDEAINLLDKDLLNTKHYVSTIVSIIEDDADNISKTIGLYGSYGSGKSSIIKTIQKKYEKNDNIKCVLYDAWKYSGDSFRRTFLKCLAEALISESDKEELVNELYCDISSEEKKEYVFNWKRLMWIGVPLFIAYILVLMCLRLLIDGSQPEYKIAEIVMMVMTGLIGIFGVLIQYDILKNIKVKLKLFSPEQFEEKFRKIVKDNIIQKSKTQFLHKKPISKLIIVIDNLDRCQPATIYSVLTDIKGFLEIGNNVITIVPIDENSVIKHCEKNTDYTVSPSELLRKIFNFHIVVKPYTRRDYFDYVKKLNEEYSLGFNNETINIIAREFVSNPRRIIQICNNLTTEINSLKDRYSLNNENKRKEDKNKSESNSQEQCSNNNHIEDVEKFLNDNQGLICKLLIIREEFPEFYKMIFEDSRILINKGIRDNKINDSNSSTENINAINRSKFELFLKYTPENKYDEITIQRLIFNQPFTLKLPNRIIDAIESSDINHVFEYISEGA